MALEPGVLGLLGPNGAGAELAELRQSQLVSNTAHRADGVHTRVIADSPPRHNARPVEACLEDAYLAALAARRTKGYTER